MKIYRDCVIPHTVFGSPVARCPGNKVADFDGNGTVDFTDFLTFVQGFGKSADQADFQRKISTSTAMAQSTFQTFCFLSTPSASLQVRRLHPQNLSLVFFISVILLVTISRLSISRPICLTPAECLLSLSPGVSRFSNINKRLYVAAIDTFHAFTEDGTPEFQLSLEVPVRTPAEHSRVGAGFRIALFTQSPVCILD